MDFTFEQGRQEPVKILGEELERVTHLKNIGTSIEEEGGIWRRRSQSGGSSLDKLEEMQWVLCGRRMPAKVKGTVYKTVIMPTNRGQKRGLQ